MPPPIADSSPENRARFVREQLPPGGLFADLTWRIAPDPFPLDTTLAAQLESLGRILLKFNRAVNLLYRQSVAGKRPAWIARWLDLGKPPGLIELQRATGLKNQLPRVIRPDLLLTDHGLAITELDAVPGGIGLTAWLNRAYTQAGALVLGGSNGMLDGFTGIFGDSPKVHIVVSTESATYRPEMEWTCQQLNRPDHRFILHDEQPFPVESGDAVYRFFELFDLDNVPAAGPLFETALRKSILLTPPPRYVFEEKLLFALLWNHHLHDFWRQELGDAFLRQLQQLVPYTWVLDPTPLPPHAAIPELGITDWTQLKTFSQRERQLVIKISGFSETAWGARSVRLGSDLSTAAWSAAIDNALTHFEQSPHILQRYAKPNTVATTWYNFADASLTPMRGRVRLCPYYFIHGEGDDARATLGGALATICPADKKIIHGMTDAILAPCAI